MADETVKKADLCRETWNAIKDSFGRYGGAGRWALALRWLPCNGFADSTRRRVPISSSSFSKIRIC